jgi:hypothetical protein
MASRRAVIIVVLAAALAIQAGATAPAPKAPPAAPAIDLLVGTWEGSWSSASTGMSGSLTCIVTRTADGKYVAAFSAIFGRIFTHKSTVTLNVQTDTDPWTFKGSEDLGFLSGGVYTYEGHSDGKEFLSTYDSTFDKGIFKMTRVPVPDTPAK